MEEIIEGYCFGVISTLIVVMILLFSVGKI